MTSIKRTASQKRHITPLRITSMGILCEWCHISHVSPCHSSFASVCTVWRGRQCVEQGLAIVKRATLLRTQFCEEEGEKKIFWKCAVKKKKERKVGIFWHSTSAWQVVPGNTQITISLVPLSSLPRNDADYFDVFCLSLSLSALSVCLPKCECERKCKILSTCPKWSLTSCISFFLLFSFFFPHFVSQEYEQ